MAYVLFIVSRAETGLYTYVQSAFAGVHDVHIILDRRHGERRRGEAPVRADRRVNDRRVYDVSRSLHQLGWAVVKPESVPARPAGHRS